MAKSALLSAVSARSPIQENSQECGGLLPHNCTAELIEIGGLPLYSEEYDDNPPAEYRTFRTQVKGCDAILFVTPEYNRSIPGVLKNALDVGSRPYGQSVWAGKPAAIISQSVGNLDGFSSNHHLRQVLTFLDMPALQQPEAYLADSSSLRRQRAHQEPGYNPISPRICERFLELIERYQLTRSRHTRAAGAAALFLPSVEFT